MTKRIAVYVEDPKTNAVRVPAVPGVSSEWGIFSDEGCLEAGFTSPEAAEAVRLARYADDDAEVLPVCHDHEGYASTRCEACDSGDDSDLDD